MSIKYKGQNVSGSTVDLSDYYNKQEVSNIIENTSNELSEEIETKQNKLTGTAGQVVGFDAIGNAVAQVAPDSGIPSGCILIWSGATDNIPTGWALCDGTNGTPDLRGRFILGASDKYAVGNTGGEEEVTLTVNQMPKHRHSFVGYNSSGSVTGPATSKGSTNYTSYEGGNLPHPNMPPYYVLCYIMKK